MSQYIFLVELFYDTDIAIKFAVRLRNNLFYAVDNNVQNNAKCFDTNESSTGTSNRNITFKPLHSTTHQSRKS